MRPCPPPLLNPPPPPHLTVPPFPSPSITFRFVQDLSFRAALVCADLQAADAADAAASAASGAAGSGAGAKRKRARGSGAGQLPAAAASAHGGRGAGGDGRDKALDLKGPHIRYIQFFNANIATAIVIVIIAAAAAAFIRCHQKAHTCSLSPSSHLLRAAVELSDHMCVPIGPRVYCVSRDIRLNMRRDFLIDLLDGELTEGAL